MADSGTDGGLALARSDTQLRTAMHLGGTHEKPNLRVSPKHAQRLVPRLRMLVEQHPWSSLWRSSPRCGRQRSAGIKEPNRQATPERRSYDVLYKSVDHARDERRSTVSFDEVQEAAHHSTKEADSM